MFWSVVMILIIALGVMILGSLFRGSEPERKDGRADDAAAGRPRRSANDLDRFLNEIQRRRQAGGRAPQPPAAEGGRPAERRSSRPPQAVPVPTARPSEQSRRRPPRPQTPSSRVPAPTPVVEAIRTALPPLAEPMVAQVVVPLDRPPLAAPAAALPAAAPPPSVRERARSPALTQLTAMLRSPRQMRAAIILREILNPPLSQRRR